MVVTVRTTITTYGIYWCGKSLSNTDFYEHRCLENIKTLYKLDGKFDDQR